MKSCATWWWTRLLLVSVLTKKVTANQNVDINNFTPSEQVNSRGDNGDHVGMYTKNFYDRGQFLGPYKEKAAYDALVSVKIQYQLLELGSD